MSVSGLVSQQPAPQPQAQTPAAVLQLVKASLEALAARLGQTLAATVLGTDANGLTQLRLGGETLTVKLSQPLPAGSQIAVQVQPSPSGTPILVIQPRATAETPSPMPLPSRVPVPAPAPSMTTAPAVPQSSQAPAPAPSATAAGPTNLSGNAAAAPVRGLPTAPPPAAAVNSTPQAAPAPVSGTGTPAAAAARAPAATPAATAAVQVAQPVAGLPQATAPARAQAAFVAPSPSPAIAATAAPSAPTPASVATLTTPSPAAAAQPLPQPAPGQQALPPATASQAGTPVTTQVPAIVSVPASSAAANPSATAAAMPGAPAPNASPAAVAANAPLAATASAAAGQTVAGPGQAAFAPAPMVAPRLAAMPGGTTASPQAGSAALPPPGAPPAAAASPGPAATTLAKPAVTAPSLSLPLTQPAQAAARQDSMAPLLQNLGALQGRLASFPQPVAEAAMRLLAARIPLDRGAPNAQTLKQAVMRAGVFAQPGPGTTQAVDVKSALLQLRAGLLSFLGSGEIAPVAPVSRRPPPPLRDAQPRGHRAEAPTLPESASAREAGRTLLHQTDAALSRLKLTQLASQPPEARAHVAGARDFVIELPMMLGHELGIAQLQVQRDGKGKGRPGERGWRLRFAVNFSVIGEVGAHVALLGETTNVVVWAGEPETAEALEAMLPELGPALAARGLKVGSVKLRRGAPEPDKPGTGRLMDAVR